MYINSGGTVGLALVAGISAWLAIAQYRINAERDKARWLHELFNRFYSGDLYRHVYLALDDLDEEFLARIRKVISEAKAVEPSVEWELAAYLNFFELVATLRKRGVLNNDDVKVLFEWPLERLAKLSGMVEYLSRCNYGELATLLSKPHES